MARDRVSVTTSAKKPDLTGFEHREIREQPTSEMKNRRNFFFASTNLSFEFYFSSRTSIFTRLFARIIRIYEKILRSLRGRFLRLLFILVIRPPCRTRAVSRRCTRYSGNHPHYLNSAKQAILHGTNVSWISSNASRLSFLPRVNCHFQRLQR